MTDAELTHLILVLDRSGSMGEGGKAAEAEKGVRALVDEQVALPGRLEISVARFDNEYELLATAAPAESLDQDLLRIQPRGMTALFDAVGRTVTTVGAELGDRAEAARPGRVVVLVATDGLENASTEYTSEALRELIDQQTNIYR
jgi:Mg-chelatase subunit ChlD